MSTIILGVWRPGVLVNQGEVVEPRGITGFGYEAIHSGSARTGTSEPNWPTIAGGTVVDGGVTWQAVTAQTITWTAVPIYKSGGAEPAFPTATGATVTDNGITWACQAPNIADSRCPNTKVAIIAGSKVFAAENDVVRFSATNNPTDWSSEGDAGFLPTGLQAQGSQDATVLGAYRSNLCVWTSSTFQVWQIDPDPERMTLLDVIENIGSDYPKSTAPVGGDLYFMTSSGIRSVTIAGGSTNLAAGDIGTPIDPLVEQLLPVVESPSALYYPARGQYWVVMNDQVLVYSQAQASGVRAWSRYVFPFTVEEKAILNGSLYVRSGDDVYEVSEAVYDDDGDAYEGVIWWPHLDFGSPGQTKGLIGIDLIGTGTCSISIGYDQTNTNAYTPAFESSPDTVPGGIIPISVTAPSFSPKLTYSGGELWRFNALSLYMQDWRMTA